MFVERARGRERKIEREALFIPIAIFGLKMYSLASENNYLKENLSTFKLYSFFKKSRKASAKVIDIK